MNEAQENLVEVSPREAVELGAESLTAYGHLFFPRTFRQDSPEFHEEMGQLLYSPTRYNAFKVFRGGAKTSLLRVYTSQRVAYAISRTIMYVSVSQPHAIMNLRWLKRQVKWNHSWRETFKLRPGDKWTDEWLEIYHGIEEEPITVLAAGVTGQIRGFNIDDFRPDLIIIDDVLNEENTATPDQRQKIENLVMGALINSLSPASESPLAKAVFLQTPLDKNDLIEKCMRDPQWHGLSFGILDYSDPAFPQGKSRWEERWSTETILAKKVAEIAAGRRRLWMREMECKIVSGDEDALDTGKLKYYEGEAPRGRTVLAIDPASSERADADQNVTIAVRFCGADVYVVDYYASTGVTQEVNGNVFFTYVLTYRPAFGAVETVGYQRTLKTYLENEMIRRRLFLPIQPFDDRRKKADRIMQAIAPILNYGHLYVKPSMLELIEQMSDYNPIIKDQRDDILDALSMAIISDNPLLGENSPVTLEGEYDYVKEEVAYAEARFGGCP